MTLYFAEIWASDPGVRVFDVSRDGETVIEAFDIHAEVGHATAMTRTFEGEVTDGVLRIGGTASTDNAKSSGIEVRRS